MSGGERVPLEEAREIAESLGSALLVACYRVEIAGSIRRRKADVGDIDLVCEPIITPALDMFGEPTAEVQDRLTERLDWMVERGHLAKRLDVNGRASWGRHLKRAVYRGLNVDIQAVTDRAAWGMWMLIRTGPASWNKRIVTPRWQGGLLPPGMEIKDGFRLYRAGGRVETPTELSVFEAYGMEYVAPEARA